MLVGPWEVLKRSTEFTLHRGFTREGGGLCVTLVSLPQSTETYLPIWCAKDTRSLVPLYQSFPFEKIQAIKKLKEQYDKPLYVLYVNHQLLPCYHICFLPILFLSDSFESKVQISWHFIPKFFILKYLPKYFLQGRAHSHIAIILLSHPRNPTSKITIW